jgi:hypothetical protein
VQSKNSLISIVEIEQVVKRLVKSFKSDEKLSDFERGQVDGLRWVLDVLDAIKNPAE